MKIPPACRDFWDAFAVSVSDDVATRFHSAFHFCDSPELANSLGQLVVDGTKRATTGLLSSYETENEALPEVGQLSIVTNFAGEPLCVIEATRVTIVPFDEVSSEFARREGEGDGSLRYWREAHWSFFARECARLGETPTGSMLVVCEEFEVVYSPS